MNQLEGGDGKILGGLMGGILGTIASYKMQQNNPLQINSSLQNLIYPHQHEIIQSLNLPPEFANPQYTINLCCILISIAIFTRIRGSSSK